MKVPMDFILIEEIKEAIFCLTTMMLFYAFIVVLVISFAYRRYEILLPVLHHKISFIRWLLKSTYRFELIQL